MHAVADKKLLWCLLCSQKFSVEDVQAGKYVIETGICMGCYKDLQKSITTCFGKTTTGKRWGYDEETVECSRFCPDKEVCRSFVKAESIQKRHS